MNIEQKLVASVMSGLKALYGQDVPAAQIQLQKTKKEFEGHLTLVVFPFLRMSKKRTGADRTGDWRISAGKRAVGIGIQCYQGLFEPDNRFFGMD